MSENHVWADGLLVFYEIFRFLEQNVPERLLPKEFHRTNAFEDDLTFYLGNDWKKNYEIRDSVAGYLHHLDDINKRNPILLIAYVYHLYMGLLSGGQILQKKRRLNPLRSGNNDIVRDGESVTFYPKHTIAELKSKLRYIIDELAEDLDESTKTLLIVESKMVFHLNNEIVRSVKGVDRANLKKICIVLVIVVAVFYLLKLKS